MSQEARSEDAARAFIALDPDPRTRELLTERMAAVRALPGLPRLRWVVPNDLHVTLKFLGDTPRERIAGIEAALGPIAAAATAPCFRRAIFEAFPRLDRANVLVFELDDEGPCAQLAAAVEDAAFGLGFPREGRRYRPHVTMARARPPCDVRFAAAAMPPIDLGRVPFTSMTLYESRTPPQGAQTRERYTPLVRFALGG
ncbi:RNA 2',3'-cyclic phosphodiesterase [Pendulispora albinea]|uniref:RNA 2',3'-cyclic phosphodiesterase n=1 Tax=Pendulispora albinea TaxID=2741071 RepID=A0ABZ2M6I7_9BACT